jgi:hypothetical protein
MILLTLVAMRLVVSVDQKLRRGSRVPKMMYAMGARGHNEGQKG